MVGLQSTTSITALSSLVRLAILILTVVSFIRRRARTLPRHRPEPHRYLPAPCRSTSVHGYRLPPLARLRFSAPTVQTEFQPSWLRIHIRSIMETNMAKAQLLIVSKRTFPALSPQRAMDWILTRSMYKIGRWCIGCSTFRMGGEFYKFKRKHMQLADKQPRQHVRKPQHHE